VRYEFAAPATQSGIRFCRKFCVEECQIPDPDECIEANRPEPNPANEIAWGVFKLKCSQVRTAGMDGPVIGLDHGPIQDYLRDIGVRRHEMADVMERLQVLEVRYVEALAEGRRIEEDARKQQQDASQNLKRAAGR
jgi:hypothetical protein